MFALTMGSAVLGWLLCTTGAVVAYTRATQVRTDEEGFFVHGQDLWGKIAFWLTICGATVGAFGTVWSLLPH
ncbi:hypothetical protein [Terrabacter sp. BE26]|uniref:hypothetical protein n=1 Tax=Terrabacter sp. BE26 TaxID=2898152 RepID=UPI0035BE4857